jgi:HD-GYP domain-containing protein (c-di-GMP phosphodiesterase class II)
VGNEMQFNLNEFLMSVSFALDFIEIDILGAKTNHGKRTGYIALKIAKELGLADEDLYDIVALGILHDNGISEKALQDKLLNVHEVDLKNFECMRDHCIIGERNISEFPFFNDPRNVLMYHHENYDGTGYFNIKGEAIPLKSQIIHISDAMQLYFNLESNNDDVQNRVIQLINKQKNKMFSESLVNAFNSVTGNKDFWLNIKDENIYTALKEELPQYSKEVSFEGIRNITKIFSKIIDSKSKFTRRHSRGLSEKAAIMADYYKLDKDEKIKLIISADLHDIGKLAVSNDILESPNKLTKEEFKIIKQHPYYSRVALQEISGFEDITEWAANHHEKLNGHGYPFGKKAEELDFNSRLMGCLDVYQAITEERPYRRPSSHQDAMMILYGMSDTGFLDSKITEDIDYIFRGGN